jgi:hypothetical protein
MRYSANGNLDAVEGKVPMLKIGSRHIGIIAALLFALAGSIYAADRIDWKPIPDALLQIDAHPATPEQLQHKGEALFWRETDRPEKPLATTDWSTKDIGSAWRVQVKLAAEGRLLDIQIPQVPDLRRGIY